MRSQAGSTGGAGKKAPTAKKTSAKYRDYASNARKPAPFGRYEDKSPKKKGR